MLSSPPRPLRPAWQWWPVPGTYTNGQTAFFSAPSPSPIRPTIYRSNNSPSATRWPARRQFQQDLFYASTRPICNTSPFTANSTPAPVLTNVTVNYATPVSRHDEFSVTLQFDRSMARNVSPLVLLTNPRRRRYNHRVRQRLLDGTNAVATIPTHPAHHLHHRYGWHEPVVRLRGPATMEWPFPGLPIPRISSWTRPRRPRRFWPWSPRTVAPPPSVWAGYAAPPDLTDFGFILPGRQFYLGVAALPVLTGLGSAAAVSNSAAWHSTPRIMSPYRRMDWPAWEQLAPVPLAFLPSTLPPPVTVRNRQWAGHSALLTWSGYNSSSCWALPAFWFNFTEQFHFRRRPGPHTNLGSSPASFQVNGLDRTKTYYFAVVGFNAPTDFNPAVTTANWSDPYAGNISGQHHHWRSRPERVKIFPQHHR